MKLLREPLVHFLALGGLLFAGFAWANQRPKSREAAQRIVITPFVLEQLRARVPPGAAAGPGGADGEVLIAEYVREEILVREARRLGLDREDPIVRVQLRQRMERLAAEKSAPAAPSERELEDFVRTHPRAFPNAEGRTPPLAERREAVRAAWQSARRQAALDAAYEALRARYEIVIEPAPAPAPAK